jgi:carboxypeptidase C (cathepsin A)
VTTKHQISLDGRKLKYTARAGRLPILDNATGEVHGHIFFTAYTMDGGSKKATRPLTFLWNGGPGSSSSLVHLIGFGPRHLQSDGAAVDNPGSWLPETDLVFVDPVGTGYSRPVSRDYAGEFYQTRGDAESVAEFIRVYRNRYEVWDAPLFLAGESFGVRRAAGVADVLQRRGITVSGLILMGAGLPMGNLTDAQRTALALPTFTAAAFINKKLSPDLQKDLQTTLRQAEAWARKDYAAALARRDDLNDDERQVIITQLSRFTGLTPSKILPESISVTMEEFSLQLLADRNQVVGHYDSRLIGERDSTEHEYDPTKDPSLKSIINSVGIMRYFMKELHYKSDLQYQGPFGGGYPPATTFRGDWMSVLWKWEEGEAGASGNAGQESPLQHAMSVNPKLRVLIASGYYDLASNYNANMYLAEHAAAEFAPNILFRGYEGGHALYTDKKVQLELKRDVAKFLGKTISPTHK